MSFSKLILGTILLVVPLGPITFGPIKFNQTVKTVKVEKKENVNSEKKVEQIDSASILPDYLKKYDVKTDVLKVYTLKLKTLDSITEQTINENNKK